MSTASSTAPVRPVLRARPIATADRQILKRDGTAVPFDQSRITRAIALAFFEVRNGSPVNPHRKDPEKFYGLDEATYAQSVRVSNDVGRLLERQYAAGAQPNIEQIQDAVEAALFMGGHVDVGRSYMHYRMDHTTRRLTRYPGDGGLSDYIAISKYARHDKDLNRRETFSEGVERVRRMHREFYADKITKPFLGEFPPDVKDLAGPALAQLQKRFAGKTVGDVIDDVFYDVDQKKVLPSMRSLQFGGAPVLKNHTRLFNCSSSPLDRPAFFKEYFHVLLSGTGVGFSVQKHHVSQLPPLPARAQEMDLPVEHHIVEDTIEGWSDALGKLVDSHYQGKKVEFSYHGIRPRGAALKTTGGKAPGHLPLKKALNEVDKILEGAAGRQLQPIECYDMCMHVAQSVLSGGVRRSATICLFSPDDLQMMSAKADPSWFKSNPQRSASNNSAVIHRAQKDDTQFRQLFEAQQKFGEPGFYFVDDKEALCNPCVEIGMKPVVDFPVSTVDKAQLAAQGKGDPDTERVSGWQMCNLSTINAAKAQTEEQFYDACISASVIGTLQAGFTHMPYLGHATRLINDKDALLGVSICGFMDNPELFFDPKVLERGAKLVRATNRLTAREIGINHAARTTCVKPEGTASLLLGAASGIHPHHAKRYFRRVQANTKEPVFKHFKAVNPQMTEKGFYRATDEVITFPVEAPKNAITRNEIGAVDFLKHVQLVQQSWVVNGTDEGNRSPDVMHNVSNTTTVTPQEWKSVADFIWQNRKSFTGVSLLAATGDKDYPQAPREEVTTKADVLKWNALQPKPVDYTKLIEHDDVTNLKGEAACAGGSCEVTSHVPDAAEIAALKKIDGFAREALATLPPVEEASLAENLDGAMPIAPPEIAAPEVSPHNPSKTVTAVEMA